MLRRKFLVGLASLPVLSTPFLAACESSGGGKSSGAKVPEYSRKDLLAVLPKRDFTFDRLNMLVKLAGMEDQLMAPGHYTLLAPSDRAFAALPDSDMKRLQRPENRDELVRLLRNHLIDDVILLTDFRRGPLRTLAKVDLAVNVRPGDRVSINGAHFERTDLRASNGVAHVISQVLVPPRRS